jgi:hypothetical protein
MAKSKALSEWLERIGGEINPESGMGVDGTIQPRTNDEMLARMLWRQALGFVETIRGPDGQTIGQRVYSPDQRAQQLILERREGKPALADEKDEHGISVLSRLDSMIKDRINAMTKKSDVETDTDAIEEM